jgi:hypothetical protein
MYECPVAGTTTMTDRVADRCLDVVGCRIERRERYRALRTFQVHSSEGTNDLDVLWGAIVQTDVEALDR